MERKIVTLDNLERFYGKLQNEKVEKLDKMIEISYADLVTLRDSSKLVPGQQYRITDYTCTTTTSGTKSAGHVFDIIVTADSVNKLNEEAHAIQHTGDSYFANSNLSAWRLWYSLDNDTTRFDWADGTNGKGVIYRMIDEFNNDVPYDFKNIQFYRQWDSSKSSWSTISSNTTGVPCYTFSSHGDSSTVEFTDCSLSISNVVYSNVIKEYLSSDKLKLNNNCFFGTSCYSNTFGNSCKNNTFGYTYHSNTFGNYCNSNTFGYGCWVNTFRSHCSSNTFGNGCGYNTFGFDCSSNTFGFDCSSNTFGNECSSNTFGYRYSQNTFGNYCRYNTFGNECYSNAFGYRCQYNTFGGNCSLNTFGNGCSSNTFGNRCQYNSFGNNSGSNIFGYWCGSNTIGNGCSSNTIGNYCYHNTFGNGCENIYFTSENSSASTKYSYYRDNRFGDGCQYIVFTGVETASDSVQVQNYNFSQGLKGTSDAYLTIDGVRNRAYETKVAKDSYGTLKTYCEADLVQ